MRPFNGKKIIGIDHGYGNIKTANSCFTTGVSTYDEVPPFKENLLKWNDKFYIIGAEHKEFTGEKMFDDDYYVLTLAAIAEELAYSGLTNSDVFIAAGLPLTWVSSQRKEFKEYLLQNENVDFTYKGVEYHVHINGADIYPQGFAAIATDLDSFEDSNMLCDIGNGTMNIMFVNDKRPDIKRCYTEKFGTQQCILAIRENLMKQHKAELSESVITKILTTGTAKIDSEYLDTIRVTAQLYVDDIFRKLREHGYDERSMRLRVVGGGGCLIKNFCTVDSEKVTINGDICATAKGYERLFELKLKRIEENEH